MNNSPNFEAELANIQSTLDQMSESIRGLLDRHFKIKTDHFSLKCLLGQRLTTPFQTKWLLKLMGYHYEISYKKGSENIVADALSRVSGGTELNSLVLTSISSDLLQQVKDSYANDLVLKVVVQQLQTKNYVGNKYSLVDGQKPNLAAYPGLLQPLPILKKVWSSISMDFIEGLPSSHGKTVIMVIVDRLSKYAHFVALQHPFTASTIAQVFLDNMYRLHGLSNSIISDRDSVSKCMTGERLKEWAMWLSLAEFCYDIIVEAVDRTMQAREQALNMLKFHLKRAQDRMKNLANKSRSDRVFEEVHTKWGYCLTMDLMGLLSAEPVVILDRKMKKVNNRVSVYILVKWSNHTDEDAT
ncbi:retrotransposon-related protein [Tanacetum coccineum]